MSIISSPLQARTDQPGADGVGQDFSRARDALRDVFRQQALERLLNDGPALVSRIQTADYRSLGPYSPSVRGLLAHIEAQSSGITTGLNAEDMGGIVHGVDVMIGNIKSHEAARAVSQALKSGQYKLDDATISAIQDAIRDGNLQVIPTLIINGVWRSIGSPGEGISVPPPFIDDPGDIAPPYASDPPLSGGPPMPDSPPGSMLDGYADIATWLQNTAIMAGRVRGIEGLDPELADRLDQLTSMFDQIAVEAQDTLNSLPGEDEYLERIEQLIDELRAFAAAHSERLTPEDRKAIESLTAHLEMVAWKVETHGKVYLLDAGSPTTGLEQQV